jgi:hypothetical protein
LSLLLNSSNIKHQGYQSVHEMLSPFEHTGREKAQACNRLDGNRIGRSVRETKKAGARPAFSYSQNLR